MAPYRGKHRRTSADEESQVAEVSETGAPASEDTGAAHSEPARPEDDHA